jgi:hypothetical protein
MPAQRLRKIFGKRDCTSVTTTAKVRPRPRRTRHLDTHLVGAVRVQSERLESYEAAEIVAWSLPPNPNGHSSAALPRSTINKRSRTSSCALS